MDAHSCTENFERLWLLHVEVVEAVVHFNSILGAYDNWLGLVPLNTFYVATPNVQLYSDEKI